MIESLKKLRQYLLTGVSFAIPFIACGGISKNFGTTVALSPAPAGIYFVNVTARGGSFTAAQAATVCEGQAGIVDARRCGIPL